MYDFKFIHIDFLNNRYVPMYTIKICKLYLRTFLLRGNVWNKQCGEKKT